MPMFATKQTFDAKLESIATEINAQRDLACAFASFYVQDRLKALEGMFPGHRFTFTHVVHGSGLSVSPALYDRTDLEDIEGDFFANGGALLYKDVQLCALVTEISDTIERIEDEFRRNLGHITTDEKLEEVTNAG